MGVVTMRIQFAFRESLSGLAVAVLVVALGVGLAACGDSSSDEADSASGAVGDPAAGEELFNTGLPGIHLGDSCATCHTLNDNMWGPPLDGLSGRAAEVDGMTAVEYLRESILDTTARPSASWDGNFNMPKNYSDVLTEQQIDDLIAYMLTL